MTNFRDASQPVVSYKDRWGDPWTEKEYLWCERLTINVSPNIDSAVLSWTFGEISKQNDSIFSTYQPLDLKHKYVRVEYQIDEVGTTRYWYGYVAKQSKITATDPDTFVKTGEQTFLAFGLEWLLDRELIETSIVEVDNGGGNFGETRINRTIAFNQGADNGKRPSRLLPNKNATTSDIFASDLDNALYWDIQSICEYLLKWMTPKDINGALQLPFSIDPLPGVDLRQFVLPANPYRRTVKQLIDSLVSPYRAVGYTVRVSGSDVELRVFSWADSAVNLPSGGVIAANSVQHDLDLQGDIRVAAWQLSEDVTNTFDRTAAIGERATHTASYVYNSPLVAGWASAWETDYNDGGSNVANYAGATIDQRQSMDAIVRGRAPIDRVFRSFVVQSGYDSTIASAWEDATDPDIIIQSWPTGMRFQRSTQLQEEYDYSGDKIDNGTYSQGVSGDPEYLPMFGLIKVGEFDSVERYGYLHRLPEYSDPENQADTDGRAWRARLSPLEDGFGFEVDTGTAPPHVFAKDDFTAALASDLALDWQTDLSWKNAFFTFSLELDYHLRAEAGSGTPANEDFLMTRAFYVEDHRLDFVAPDTYVGVDEDGVRQHTDGGFVRNDSQALSDIATLSHEWYSRPRIMLSFSYRSTHVSLLPGEMIATVTDGINGATSQPISVDVGAVITEVDYDFRTGHTSVSTGYGDIEGAL